MKSMEAETEVQMMNVLDKVKEERNQVFEYLDEKIFSNIYYISFSSSLKALAGMSEKERINKREKHVLFLFFQQKILQIL